MKKENNSLESLLNIGKVTAKKLKAIGINSKKDFLERDPYDIFHDLKTKVDPALCRCALATIVGAHQNISWHKITKQAAKEYEKRHPDHRWGKC